MTRLALVLLMIFLFLISVYLWFFLNARPFRNLDVPLHIAGGFWSALFIFWIFKKRKDPYLLTVSWEISLLLVVSFSVFVGMLWEFYEFLYDVFISSTRSYAYLLQLGTADTIKDLFFDLVGGVLGWLYVRFGLLLKR